MLLQLSNFGATASPHTVNVPQIRVYKKPASSVELLFKHCRDFVGDGSVAKTENSIRQEARWVAGADALAAAVMLLMLTVSAAPSAVAKVWRPQRA